MHDPASEASPPPVDAVAASAAPPRKPAVWERVRAAPVTFGIAAINVALFAVAESHGSTNTVYVLLRFGAIERVHVWAGEPWRLFTAMFLHIGVWHLLWNTYASVGWCAKVETALGQRRFALLYLASGFAGSCASVLLHDVVGAGASGAVFGIIGATLVLRRRALPSWSAFRLDRESRSTLINMAVWTALGLTAVPMDHYAHLGGLLAGVAVTWVMTDAGAPRRRATLAVGFALLAVVTAHPGWRPSPAEAQLLVGYAWDYQTHNEVRSAARLLERACAADSSDACMRLGHLLVEAAGPERDVPRAVALYSKGCAGGSAAACAGAGELLRRGDGVPRDPAKSAQLFRRACAGGYQDGCGAYGLAQRSGNGVPRDEAAGRKAIEEACKKGSEWSCGLLASPAAGH
jgi:rhomboid protease GluP